MILGALLSHLALLTFADRSYLTVLRSLEESTQSLREPSGESMLETSKTSLGLVLRNDQHHEPLGRN